MTFFKTMLLGMAVVVLGLSYLYFSDTKIFLGFELNRSSAISLESEFPDSSLSLINKCGVNGFRVDNSCGENLFRSASFVCHDGYTGTLGSDSSCKSSETWLQYVTDACAGRCTIPNPSIHIYVSNESTGSLIRDDSLTVEQGAKISIFGDPVNFDFNNPNFSRAFFFDPIFDGSCTNNSSADRTWIMNCSANNSGVSNFYVEIYYYGQTYRSNNITVTVLETTPTLTPTPTPDPSEVPCTRWWCWESWVD